MIDRVSTAERLNGCLGEPPSLARIYLAVMGDMPTTDDPQVIFDDLIQQLISLSRVKGPNLYACREDGQIVASGTRDELADAVGLAEKSIYRYVSRGDHFGGRTFERVES